jgi:membrane protein implicated in regulation of membrane protease activity
MNGLNNNSKFRNYIILYTDMIIRGLIAFFVIGIGFYIFLVLYLKVKAIYVLFLVFLASILISPFLSRIKLGEKTLCWYEGLLTKFFSKTLETK